MIDFKLYFEYISDADMENAQRAEAAWQQRVLDRQERMFHKIMTALIARAGIGRLFTWL